MKIGALLAVSCVVVISLLAIGWAATAEKNRIDAMPVALGAGCGDAGSVDTSVGSLDGSFGDDPPCDDPPPDDVEEIDEWRVASGLNVPSSLEITGPTIICAGSDPLTFGFTHDGGGSLDHGIIDKDEHREGDIVTTYSRDEDCDLLSDTSDPPEWHEHNDSIDWEWSRSDNVAMEKNAQGYGVFTVPEEGATVTVKATFSDGGDTPDGATGSRDDTSDHTEEFEVKVVGVASLLADQGTDGGTLEGESPNDPTTQVQLVAWDPEGEVEVDAAATLSMSQDEWAQIASCYSLTVWSSNKDGEPLSLIDPEVSDTVSIAPYPEDDPEGTVEGLRATITTDSPGFYLVRAKAGTQEEKRVLIQVIKITLHVDVSGDGKDDIEEGVITIHKGGDATYLSGHAIFKQCRSGKVSSQLDPESDIGDIVYSVDSMVGVALWSKNTEDTWVMNDSVRISASESEHEVWIEAISVGEWTLTAHYEVDGQTVEGVSEDITVSVLGVEEIDFDHRTLLISGEGARVEVEASVQSGVDDEDIYWETNAGHFEDEHGQHTTSGKVVYWMQSDGYSSKTEDDAYVRAQLAGGCDWSEERITIVELDSHAVSGSPGEVTSWWYESVDLELAAALRPTGPVIIPRLINDHTSELAALLDDNTRWSFDPYHPTIGASAPTQNARPISELFEYMSVISQGSHLDIEVKVVQPSTSMPLYDLVGSHRVWFTYTSPHTGEKHLYNFIITIDAADLEVDGLGSNEESYPGALIPLTDPEDSIEQVEDQLVAAVIRRPMPASMISGTLTVETVAGADRIQIYTMDQQGQRVLIGTGTGTSIEGQDIGMPGTAARWVNPTDIQGFQDTLYIRGINPSDQPRDVELLMVWRENGVDYKDEEIHMTVGAREGGAIITTIEATSVPARPQGFAERLYDNVSPDPTLVNINNVPDLQILVDVALHSQNAVATKIANDMLSHYGLFVVGNPVHFDLLLPDDREWLTLCLLSRSANSAPPDELELPWGGSLGSDVFRNPRVHRMVNATLYGYQVALNDGKYEYHAELVSKRLVGLTPFYMNTAGADGVYLRVAGVSTHIPIPAAAGFVLSQFAPPVYLSGNELLENFSGKTGGAGETYSSSDIYVRAGDALIGYEGAILGFNAPPFFSHLVWNINASGSLDAAHELGHAPSYTWPDHTVYEWDEASQRLLMAPGGRHVRTSNTGPFPGFINVQPPNEGPVPSTSHKMSPGY